MTPLWIALQFLTIVPIHLKQMPSPQQNAASLLFYPLIGLGIGLILFALANLWSVLPHVLSASLILGCWVILTGGLHLDGLADSADAWVGGFGDRTRTLEIMKDPRSGPIGVLSLVLLCLVKWSSLYVLLDQQMLYALILFPVLGRLAPLFLLLSCDYVRATGLGSSMAHFLPKTWAIIILISSLAASAFWGWRGVFSATWVLLGLLWLRHCFIARVGGVTGDTLGAAIEVSEAVALLGFVCVAYYL